MRVLKTVYAIDIDKEESHQAYLAYLWSLSEYRRCASEILDFSEHIRREFNISGYREAAYLYLVIPSEQDTPEFREHVETWARNFLGEAIMQMQASKGLLPFAPEKAK